MQRFLALTLALALSPWARALDLNETQAIKLYLEKNLEVAALRFDIDLVKAQELTAGLWANPSLFIDSQLNPFGKSWNQKNAGGPTQQDFILNIPLDVNGKRRQAVKVGRLATKVAHAQFQAFVREGLFSTLQALYGVQRFRREHELLEEKGQLLERLVHTLEKRIGSTSSQPLIQSRARLAHEDVKLEIQKNKIDQNEVLNRLKVLLHVENTEDVVPHVAFKNPSEEKFQLDELVANAKKKRPDFVALGFLREQLEGQLELDEKGVWDDLVLGIGVSRQNAVGARPGDSGSGLPGASSWLVGVTIPIPVFDRNQGQIMQTKLRTNQAMVREKFMLDEVSKEIDTSLKKIEITGLNLNRFKSGQLSNAKIVRDSALRQFGTGATSLLEYLDAVDAYHVSIQKYLAAQHDFTLEHLKLKLISGQEVSP